MFLLSFSDCFRCTSLLFALKEEVLEREKNIYIKKIEEVEKGDGIGRMEPQMDQNSHYLDVVYMEFSAVVYISRDSGHIFLFSRSDSPGKKFY